jgi:hypothetical protein
MGWRRATFVTVTVAIAVIGLTVAIVPRLLPQFKLIISAYKLGGGVEYPANVWMCVPYDVQGFPANALPAKVQVSSTLAKIYLQETCEGTGFADASVPIKSFGQVKEADFFLWSDTAGNTTVTATAQGSGLFGMSYKGTRSITFNWPDVVPACKNEQGSTTCVGKCTYTQKFGFIYTRIPYTDPQSDGCCPKPPGHHYQLYGPFATDPFTCKKDF